MKVLLTISIVIAAFGVALSGDADSLSPIKKLRSEYQRVYPFFEMPDTLYTPQGELQLAEGYEWPDSSRLTPFQNWMNHFPIWHQYKPVGIWNGGIAFKHDQITRCIHIPWTGPAFKDFSLPWRIGMEYLRFRQAESLFTFVPNNGSAVSYSEYLRSKVVYGPRGSLKLLPDTARIASVEEFYRCFGLAITNMNYKTLIANCDSISASELGPGDLFLASDSTGKSGVAYVIMFAIQKGKKDKLFAVATGGKTASDFHIPLFNNDRNRPWINTEQIQALAPSDATKSGFYRLSFMKNFVNEKHK